LSLLRSNQPLPGRQKGSHNTRRPPGSHAIFNTSWAPIRRVGGGRTTLVRTTAVKTRWRHRESNPKPVADNVLLWDYSQQCSIFHSSMPARISNSYNLHIVLKLFHLCSQHAACYHVSVFCVIDKYNCMIITVIGCRTSDMNDALRILLVVARCSSNVVHLRLRLRLHNESEQQRNGISPRTTVEQGRT
jgi:hypothetical protein